MNCPGSVMATRHLVDKPSQYAVAGTAAHTVSEWVRERGVPASTFLGTTIRVTRGEEQWNVKCTQTMVDSVQAFVDNVATLPGAELVEGRVQYEEYVAGGFGTLDSGKLNDRVCYVTDFKHGTGVKKDAKENPQLMFYALGLYLDYRWLYEFDKFVLAICQPRLDHYDTWETTLDELLTWAETVVRPVAKLALSPDAPFRPGDWCMFCKLKTTCEARAAAWAETATADFNDLTEE